MKQFFKVQTSVYKLLAILALTFPSQVFTASHPYSVGVPGIKQKEQRTNFRRENQLDPKNQTEAEDRKFLKPPTFPYWGPFGLTSTALFCAFYVGPFAGSWNRACAGPVPPFQATTTTTTPKPNITQPYYGYGYGYPPPPVPFPGPYPPPQGLSFPYDNSFYPLQGNVLAINKGRRRSSQDPLTKLHGKFLDTDKRK